MSKPKQATLFQSWSNKPTSQTKQKNNDQLQGADFGDDVDDDALLAMALAESLKEAQIQEQTQAGPSGHIPADGQKLDPPGPQGNVPEDVGNFGFDADVFDDENDIIEAPDISHIINLPGFDLEAGRLWIYPTNYPVREYQYNITQQAIYKNTLVTLPTGLGKTFIAAVVMYNFYRWYPQGKVIFMAPTKPLVAQQIEACYNIMGIPQSDTAEMTG